jgi:hypothetical protein
MEKHLFKFGKGSAAFIVPKRWIEKRGLKYNGAVFISENEAGDLIVSTKNTLKEDAAKIIDDKTSVGIITRWIGVHYMYGTHKLKISSRNVITRAQVRAVEDKVEGWCSGFEIVSQSKNDMIIEDLGNMGEIDIVRIITRLRSLTNQIFWELIDGDPKTVPEIERLTNRYYMMGVRHVNLTQAKDSLKYFSVLKMIETIGDDLEYIAINYTVKNKAYFRELQEQFDLCFTALGGDEEAIESIALFREDIKRRIKEARMEEAQANLIRDIINKVSNIAEFGLKVSKKEQY